MRLEELLPADRDDFASLATILVSWVIFSALSGGSIGLLIKLTLKIGSPFSKLFNSLGLKGLKDFLFFLN